MAEAGHYARIALLARYLRHTWPANLQVLCGSQQLAEQLGPLLWPACAAVYITTKLKPIQPQSDAEVGACTAPFYPRPPTAAVDRGFAMGCCLGGGLGTASFVTSSAACERYPFCHLKHSLRVLHTVAAAHRLGRAHTHQQLPRRSACAARRAVEREDSPCSAGSASTLCCSASSSS